jgi:taurine transport system substrate-binding protein
VSVIEKYSNSFLSNKAAWGPDSDNAKLLAKLLGGTAADQAAGILNLSLLPLNVQASDAWLGGGEKSGIAKILKETAGFLKEQKKISDVLPSYAAFVTPSAVSAPKK